MEKAPPFGSTAYREYFRSTVDKRLDGRWYALANLIVLGSIITALAQAIHWENSFWALLPAYFLLNNGLEYLLHRYPMHHKTRGMEVVYEHVTIHHNFYANEHFFFEEPRDFYAAILPAYIFVGLTVVICTVSGAVYLAAGANHAFFYAANAYAYYLMYEILHFSYHASESSLLKKVPFIRPLARAHILHHQVKLMAHYNFNITFPIFDAICKTWYQEKQKISQTADK